MCIVDFDWLKKSEESRKWLPADDFEVWGGIELYKSCGMLSAGDQHYLWLSAIMSQRKGVCCMPQVSARNLSARRVLQEANNFSVYVVEGPSCSVPRIHSKAPAHTHTTVEGIIVDNSTSAIRDTLAEIYGREDALMSYRDQFSMLSRTEVSKWPVAEFSYDSLQA